MRLSDYLDSRGETIYAFANRVGIPLRTMYDIAEGADCRITTAAQVIDGTNGKVRLMDLVLTAREAQKSSQGGRNR